MTTWLRCARLAGSIAIFVCVVCVLLFTQLCMRKNDVVAKVTNEMAASIRAVLINFVARLTAISKARSIAVATLA